MQVYPTPLQGSAVGMAVRPPPPSSMALAVYAIAAIQGLLAVAGAAKVIQVIVDREAKIFQEGEGEQCATVHACTKGHNGYYNALLKFSP